MRRVCLASSLSFPSALSALSACSAFLSGFSVSKGSEWIHMSNIVVEHALDGVSLSETSAGSVY